MDLEKIKEVIQLMNQEDLVEIELEEEGRRIKLRRREEKVMKEREASSLSQVISSPPKRAESEEGLIQIKAPMVGTFYRAPAPDAPPFVEVGEIVEAGQTVCIIEAMKLMNEIKSEVRGKLLEVLVEDGAAVEYGQPLFKLELLK